MSDLLDYRNSTTAEIPAVRFSIKSSAAALALLVTPIAIAAAIRGPIQLATQTYGLPMPRTTQLFLDTGLWFLNLRAWAIVITITVTAGLIRHRDDASPKLVDAFPVLLPLVVMFTLAIAIAPLIAAGREVSQIVATAESHRDNVIPRSKAPLHFRNAFTYNTFLIARDSNCDPNPDLITRFAIGSSTSEESRDLPGGQVAWIRQTDCHGGDTGCLRGGSGNGPIDVVIEVDNGIDLVGELQGNASKFEYGRPPAITTFWRNGIAEYVEQRSRWNGQCFVLEHTETRLVGEEESSNATTRE